MLYAPLAELFSRLEKVPSKLSKTALIADFIRDIPENELPAVVRLLQGSVFPSWDMREIGIASQLMAKVIATAAGFSEEQILKKFKAAGDFGSVLEELVAKKKQATLFRKTLTVERIVENLQKAASVEGKGAQDRKAQLISELISSASPPEAKYLVRTVLADLRIGVAEGMVRDAIVKAFFAEVASVKDELKLEGEKKHILLDAAAREKLDEAEERLLQRHMVTERPAEKIKIADLWSGHNADMAIFADQETASQRKRELANAVEWAWFLHPDYGEVARIAKTEGAAGLLDVRLEIGKPIQVLLSEKAPSLEAALESYQRPVIEWKFDGMRTLIQKKGDRVWLFTRRLENVTKQFPDLVALVKKAVTADACIIEGEALAIDPKTRHPLPFQILSQRIKRKYGIEEMAKKIPVQVNLFDALLIGGKVLFTETLESRRKKLESAVREIPGSFQFAKQLVTLNLKQAQAFYQAALDAKQEGVMVKNLDATYQPGRRVAGGWLKVKPVMETLDLAIVGGVWGTGKRTGFLGSLILGARDEDGQFRECGMIGTGIKEKSESGGVTLAQLTDLLKPHITREKENRVWTTPTVVVEVAYEEIQKSPIYESGFALRFPRVLRIRDDRGPHDADTLERLQFLYESQFAKKVKS